MTTDHDKKITCDDGTYDYVRATVTDSGIKLSYKATELSIAGRDFIDEESANEWTDSDVRNAAAQWLGITDGHHQIEVIHD